MCKPIFIKIGEDWINVNNITDIKEEKTKGQDKEYFRVLVYTIDRLVSLENEHAIRFLSLMDYLTEKEHITTVVAV